MLAHSMRNIKKYLKKDKSDMTIEAMKLALEALEGFVEHGTCSDDEDMAKARAAIAAAKEQS